MARSYGKCMFTFIRNCQTISAKHLHNLGPFSQCVNSGHSPSLPVPGNFRVVCLFFRVFGGGHFHRSIVVSPCGLRGRVFKFIHILF